MTIAPLTPAERQELTEILGSLGVFGSRFHTTHYSRRPQTGGNTKPIGSTMSPEMRASMQRSMDAAEAKLKAKLAEQAGGAFSLSLGHYGEPIKIAITSYGLTVEEHNAMRQPTAKLALEEYSRSDRKLRQGGTSLSDYMKGAYLDEQEGAAPPALLSASQKLQKHFGEVADLSKGGLIAV